MNPKGSLEVVYDELMVWWMKGGEYSTKSLALQKPITCASYGLKKLSV